MKPKTSFIWTYFTEINSDYVKCKLCDKKYSRKGRGTTALKNHLRSGHPIEYKEFLKQNKEKKQLIECKKTQQTLTPMQEVKKQLTLQESFLYENAWETSHPKSKEIDKLVTEMIALQNLPFNFIEGIGFRRLMHAVVPRYHLRGRQFFTTNVSDDIYPKIVVKIKELLKNMDHLSFTTDIWSEPSAGVSLLSLTCHGITYDFKRLTIMLKCETFEGSHTGEIIATKFESMLRYWDIPREKVHCIVRDGGANMRKAVQLSNYNDIDCVVHKLQLCIRAALQSQEDVTNLIAKCKQVAGHFQHSLLAQDQLNKIQRELLNQSPLSVIQECSTRWNSSLYMMQRLLQIKDALSLYANKNTRIQQISSQEWLDIEKYVDILKPFEETTKSLSDLQASIACVIPLIHVLKSSLQEKERSNTNPTLQKVIVKLMTEMNNRFGELKNNNMFAMATYLDPKFKMKFFNEIIKEKVENEILSSCSINKSNSILNERSPPKKKRKTNNNEAQPSTSTTKPDTCMKTGTLNNLLMDILSSSDEESDHNDEDLPDQTMILKSLLNEYINSKKLNFTEDPLMWWKGNSKYEKLHSLVQKYLSPPPSSVPSEQLFSGAGLIYDELRNRLKGEKACQLLFLKYDLPLLNFEY